jgi:hypothetical protein
MTFAGWPPRLPGGAAPGRRSKRSSATHRKGRHGQARAAEHVRGQAHKPSQRAGEEHHRVRRFESVELGAGWLAACLASSARERARPDDSPASSRRHSRPAAASCCRCPPTSPPRHLWTRCSCRTREAEAARSPATAGPSRAESLGSPGPQVRCCFPARSRGSLRSRPNPGPRSAPAQHCRVPWLPPAAAGQRCKGGTPAARVSARVRPSSPPGPSSNLSLSPGPPTPPSSP